MEDKVLEILERNFNESIEFDRNKATEELLILFGVSKSLKNNRPKFEDWLYNGFEKLGNNYKLFGGDTIRSEEECFKLYNKEIHNF